MRILLLCLTFLISACATRPLTTSEQAFMQTIMGDELDVSDVSLTKGSVMGLAKVTVPPRPRTTCREKLYPALTEPVEGQIPAFAFNERIFYARRFWVDDFLGDYPRSMRLDDAMRLAHELTHVWQWQTRERTGYTPYRAAAEHQGGADPYLIDIDESRPFLSYGYEQQGSIVEEYVCCRALDPDGARTAKLRRLVSQVFPAVARYESVPRSGIRIPWDGAEIEGICGQT